MINKAKDLDFTNKKVSMIIAGVPGIGKTTLALSAPKPLLVDLDGGVSRVEGQYRKDTLIAQNYEELIDDLHSDLSAYETIVIDTGGKLLELLKPVVIKDSPKNAKTDGSLSLQGYGAVKRKFSDFVSFVRSLNKHLVIVFHASEVQLSNDITGLRIRIEGSSRDEVWDDMDLGGFIEMRGSKRVIGFTNCDRYYAKGTHQIKGEFAIPALDGKNKNDFLTKLFKMYIDNLNQETEELKEYDAIVQELKPQIENATKENINELYQKVKTLNVLTVKEELGFALKSKVKELELKYNKESDRFE